MQVLLRTYFRLPLRALLRPQKLPSLSFLDVMNIWPGIFSRLHMQ